MRNLDRYFTKLSNEEINKILFNDPTVLDYIQFSLEIGWGTIGEMHDAIYSGLIETDDIYDPSTAKEQKNIVLFGDDFSGYCGGFMKDEWKLVEIDHSAEMIDLQMTFDQFIRG
ncbi:hypothetical protein K6959_07960 [Bacillus aquiflavi]|uniref:hypothetical protein n=1 Tax=Bacillus aquiflavi TaxID=2672567 RepID=UPI001CA83F7E|nr:hypothetical protein [Bacillus aquiflavi]UAC49715.1 hypothetical protein K6959_07960 [Bacillus aquiflavi]